MDGIPHLVGLSEAMHDSHKASRTNYWVLERAGDYSLVALQPLSGRKHQLRIHLAQELAMPIVGDTLYQGDHHSPAPSILLHCFCIKINVCSTSHMFKPMLLVPHVRLYTRPP
ncbi:hypothetical protein DSO57_1034289 [Entomophthora muscae]|uniref:Uncharacterized protein n=2 Tax=Entomophthora muscae TaxID=34485 RepID=A0ACC2TUD1_9FUNG|nr:hypothetical protein DSO57_1007087 [Entomophthora muscae]KAJ9083483.1 hypothetical protein DSO57_1034289 [Entomophthora muscae]